MRKSICIEGFRDRMYEACAQTGLSKAEIARRCGFDRKTLYDSYDNFHAQMNSGYLARFCAVTGVSEDWLLGLSADKSRRAC